MNTITVKMKVTGNENVSVLFENQAQAIEALCKQVFGAAPSYPEPSLEEAFSEMEGWVGVALPPETQESTLALRDHFAGIALQAIVAKCPADVTSENVVFGLRARGAYSYADAMLEARNS